MPTVKAIFYLFFLFATCFSQPCFANDLSESEKFVKVTRDNNKPIAFKTAIVSYQANASKEPTEVVDLIAAVHIGDRTYYQELNDRFKSYDSILYELVAPEGHQVDSDAKADNPLSFLQIMMKDLLKLEYQLTGIDYSASNFVHADISPEQFTQSMKERGESFSSMFFRLMLESYMRELAAPNQAAELRILFALIGSNKALQFKRVLAEELADMRNVLSSFVGPEGSTLVTVRNDIALKVLKKELAAGKKRVGIFYGAAHLPDMDHKLRRDFGLEPVKTDWVVAWDLR